MKRIYEKLNHEEEIEKISLWKRLLILLVYYIRLGLHDVAKALSHLIDKDKRKVLFQTIWKYLSLFYLKFHQEGILKEAAALTYITLLGFIPFLVLVVLVVPKLPFLQGSSQLQVRLYDNFLPMSIAEVGPIISDLMAKKISFNIFSFVAVIITSYSLFKVIRDTFDRILRMEFQPQKDLVSQLLKFFGTLILGFLIILLLFSSSSLPVISSLLDIPLFKQNLLIVIPFILQFLGLVFLYMILPSIKVKRKSLFRAAFWTTLVWVMVKAFFDYYIYNMTNMSAFYGMLLSLPAFLFWVYVNWVVILSGIVLVSLLEYKELAVESKKEKHFVRLTVEMYTNKKLVHDIDKIISKDKLPELINKLNEDAEK
jgi:membrane protein